MSWEPRHQCRRRITLRIEARTATRTVIHLHQQSRRSYSQRTRHLWAPSRSRLPVRAQLLVACKRTAVLRFGKNKIIKKTKSLTSPSPLLRLHHFIFPFPVSSSLCLSTPPFRCGSLLYCSCFQFGHSISFITSSSSSDFVVGPGILASFNRPDKWWDVTTFWIILFSDVIRENEGRAGIWVETSCGLKEITTYQQRMQG